MTSHPAQNIGFLFRQVAKSSPEQEAFVSEDLSLTRTKLWQIIECYAQSMRDAGIGKGDLVSLDTGSAVVAIASVFALSLVGAQYVPFSEELLESKLLPVRHFIRSAERPELNGVSNVVIDHTWSPKFRDTTCDRFDFQGFDDPQQTAWIVPSSGTMGIPKFSALSEQLLYDRTLAIGEDYEDPQTRLLILFPCMSRPYIIRAVSALLAGQCLIDAQSPQFCQSMGVNFMCASPQQAQYWLAGHTFAPKARVLQLSGARVQRHEIEQLLTGFERVEDVYGSNETIKAHINLYTNSSGGLTQQTKPGSSFVQVVNENNVACAKDVKGRVRIKSRYMVEGYLNDKTATEKHFKDGWFYPGDIAVWHNDQTLEILGREDDIINIGGQKASLADLDKCLLSAGNVSASSCFKNPIEGHDDRLAACLQLSGAVPTFEAVDRAWKACSEKFGPLLAPSVIFVVDSLPITVDGIVPRKQALDIFIKGLRTTEPDELNQRLYIFEVNFDE